MIVTDVVALTADVDTLKVADVAPAGIVTLAAVVAAELLLLVKAMLAPPAGAGPVRVAVPVTAV